MENIVSLGLITPENSAVHSLWVWSAGEGKWEDLECRI